MTKEQVYEIVKSFAAGYSDDLVATTYGIDIDTVKALRKENAKEITEQHEFLKKMGWFE